MMLNNGGFLRIKQIFSVENYRLHDFVLIFVQTYYTLEKGCSFVHKAENRHRIPNRVQMAVLYYRRLQNLSLKIILYLIYANVVFVSSKKNLRIDFVFLCLFLDIRSNFVRNNVTSSGKELLPISIWNNSIQCKVVSF